MFGFSSGGSSIGGHFSANSFTNSPVSFGGNITQGNMTTGSVDQTSNTSSTGGTTDQSLSLSIPPIPALMVLDTSVRNLVVNNGGTSTVNSSPGHNVNIENADVKAVMNIISKAGSSVNINNLALEPTGHLNLNAAGGKINIGHFLDRTGGSGVHVTRSNGGVVNYGAHSIRLLL